MAVHDQNFLAAVARHLVCGFLQKIQLKMRAVCHGSGLVFGLENLAEVVLRKDHCVLLVGSVQRGIAHIKQISAQRQVRAMFLQNAERQQACALGLLNSATKVRGSQFFPMGREFGLRPQRRRTEKQDE